MSNTVNSEGNVQHGQVDETPLSPVEEMKSPLEKLLKQRPNEKELIEVRVDNSWGPRPQVPTLT
ncbi:hypothetical protein EMMF5_000357 [Cystobasidiomycetes sp. EMM_F5]